MAAVFVGTAIMTISAVDAAFIKTESGRRVTKWAVLPFVCIAFVASIYGNQTVWQLAGYKSFSIPSTGMAPTVMKGEKIIANMHAYRGALPRRGDVVILDNPEDVGHPLLKRVIAIPGDTIEGKNGKITLNGARIAEPYVMPGGDLPEVFNDNDSNDLLLKTYNFGPVKLAPKEYFVMGDNRPVSYDSRHTGPVKLQSIRGKALYVLDRNNKARDGKRLD